MRRIWEALESNGSGVITDWGLQPEQVAKLDQKLDMLAKAEVDSVTGQATLPPNLLAGPGFGKQKWIYKLKVHGKVNLRPLLCLGPLDRAKEWTVLLRATEKDNKMSPQPVAAAAMANVRRDAILQDSKKRKLIPGR